jgi:hypothetical protein
LGDVAIGVADQTAFSPHANPQIVFVLKIDLELELGFFLP